MASDYDATEFVDGDFERQKRLYSTPASQTPARAPSRDEVDAKVAQAQAKIADLKRAQEELERERSALEETRRRQTELQTGKTEMIQHLTRGLGLLGETEFASRRDAEQMSKAIADMRDALSKVQRINEDTWTKENYHVQLTHALTTLENARMEWNSARLKFAVLNGAAATRDPAAEAKPESLPLGDRPFAELCRYGLALTWPVAVAVLIAGLIIGALLLRR